VRNVTIRTKSPEIHSKATISPTGEPESSGSALCSHETFQYVSTAAALLLLTLGATTARADQGYAYALVIDNGSSANVSAGYSLNPGGGIPQVSRTGKGTYTVTFPNSGIGDGWAVEATAYGETSGYCNATGFGGASYYVKVLCYSSSSSGAATATNSSFMVLAVSNQNDKNIAFGFADQPTATGAYAANPSFSYNPSGAISVENAGTGQYNITFSGLNATGGTVQIGAFESSATCYSQGWGPTVVGQNFKASAGCVDPSGNAVNSIFVIFVVPAGVTPTGIAFTAADQPTTASYTPDPQYTYNPTGKAVNVTRSSTGQYAVTFAALNAAQVFGGNILATAENTASRCNVEGLLPGANSTAIAAVGCYSLSGGPTDTDFLLLALPAMGYAQALVTADASVVSIFSVNPGVTAPTGTHVGPGSYTVTFPNSGIDAGWNVQATAYGGDPTTAKWKAGSAVW
jgi:hypothetical protein